MVAPRLLQDLSSLTGDLTCGSCSGCGRVLKCWATRKVPGCTSYQACALAVECKALCTYPAELSLSHYLPVSGTSLCMKMLRKSLSNEMLVPGDGALRNEVPLSRWADFCVTFSSPVGWQEGSWAWTPVGLGQLKLQMSRNLCEFRSSPTLHSRRSPTPSLLHLPTQPLPPTGRMRTLECEINTSREFISW